MKIAVIGSGITGLGAAWLLSERHEVVLFESEPRLGGHANTFDVLAPEGTIPIDTGFIVYNTVSYPNLIALFDLLQVPTAGTTMGFAVSLDGGGYEYSGSGLGGLFGQWSNIASPTHWRMTRDIFRFFKEASSPDALTVHPGVTLGSWLQTHGYSQRFIDAHIVPMGAAIWSTPAGEMLQFPFAAFARFFSNHGLLQAFNRPPWRTVRGGSREYVTRLAGAYKGRVSLGDAVVDVRSAGATVTVTTASGASDTFDGALFACHADKALALASNAEPGTKELLSAFKYSDNLAVLHTDARQMPKRKRIWASWNYISPKNSRADRLSVSYWMNALQPLATTRDYFVTLNPIDAIASDKVIERVAYRHPVFSAAAMNAQSKFWRVQGQGAMWFAGAYLGYGFHEDGLQAGLAAAEDMSLRLGGESGKVVRPWPWDASQSRIATHSKAERSASRVPAP